MKRFILGTAMAMVFIGTVAARDVQEDFGEIERLIDQNDRPALLQRLQTLRSSDPKSFTARNYDYLLARIAEMSGNLALAMAQYQAVADRDTALKAYAIKHLSQIARSNGNLILERLYLDELRLVSPESLLANSARIRSAANAYEMENYGETIRLLSGPATNRSVSTGIAATSTARPVKLLLARAYLSAGQTALAREGFARLIETDRQPAQPDDNSNAAAKALDLIDGGREGKAPQLSEEEHFRRTNIYQANREFVRARSHFAAVVAGFPNSVRVPDAIFQTGRTFVQESDFVSAISEFERIREQYPASNAAKDALLQAASGYSRVGKPREAIARYQQFIEKYPDDEKLDRAYLNIVDILRDQGEDVEALRWCSRTREAFGSKLPVALAAFSAARIHIAAENWTNALATLDEIRQISDLGGAAVPGGTTAVEIAFLRAFVLERQRKYPEAIDGYLAIPDGRGEYYGWRATLRLHTLGTEETSRSYIDQKIGTTLSAGLTSNEPETRFRSAKSILRMTDSADLRERALSALRSAIADLPRYHGVPKFKASEGSEASGEGKSIIGRILAELGLFDEAAPEIEENWTGKHLDAADAEFELSGYYSRGDRGDRAIGFIEPIWRKLPADYPIELMPRDHLHLLYPAPYSEMLVRSAEDRGVDPRLILAIMRQESRFRADARSDSAARGLMQFIEQTAGRMAGELGRDHFDPDELYDPETSILFGSQYVAGLFSLFPGQPDAVTASYNGGEDNMKRWFARSRSSLPERYVPEILYAQTKDYVFKVMASYRMYQHLYDEHLRAR